MPWLLAQLHDQRWPFVSDGISKGGDRRSLEHHVPQQTSPATNGAFPAQSATVMRDGGEPCERSGLFAGDLARFGHFGNQHCAGNRTDPRNGA